MKKGGLGIIIGMFLIVLVGSIFLTSIADTISIIDTPISITNETLVTTGLINATDVNTSRTWNLTNNDWVDNSISIDASNGTALVEGTDFSVNYNTEAINFSNTSIVWESHNQTANNTGVTYQYYHTNYIDSTVSRTLIALIPLFFVIGILLFVIDKLKDGELFSSFR